MGKVTVDFVARDQAHGGWALVLVEEGPWDPTDVEDQLSRIQERLYGCLDAALDGPVARQFPESIGKPLVIRLDAYAIPDKRLSDFFNRFRNGLSHLPDYASAILACEHYPSIAFELNHHDSPHTA